MGIRVRAKHLGYFEHKRRREGQEFVVATEKEFSDKWMERLDVVDDDEAAEVAQQKKRRNAKKVEPVMIVEDGSRPSDDNVL